ncbi:hypothetical protein U9M48_023190 [Paspalum notatum var. saurae]|uniref:Uncharacterized protein n=1 Tax=Paspalum notatum var. saurae TaxID=547442 RepID=A0AAQ3WUW0_PASNO
MLAACSLTSAVPRAYADRDRDRDHAARQALQPAPAPGRGVACTCMPARVTGWTDPLVVQLYRIDGAAATRALLASAPTATAASARGFSSGPADAWPVGKHPAALRNKNYRLG